MLTPDRSHVATTNPTHPPPPSAGVASTAASVSNTTDRAANMADAAAIRIGEKIVEAGQTVGEQLPDTIAKPAQPVREEDKSDLRKMAESGWEQVSIAAKGVASAGVTVGGALSESAHRAVEHNFGKEAESVAQGKSVHPTQDCMSCLISLRRHPRQKWTRSLICLFVRA